MLLIYVDLKYISGVIIILLMKSCQNTKEIHKRTVQTSLFSSFKSY